MKAWLEFAQKLESSFGKEAIEKWLLPLKVHHFDARNLYLQAEDSFQISWFEEHIRPYLSSFRNYNHQKITVHLSLMGEEKKEPKRKFSFFTDSPLKHASFDNFFPTKGTKEAWEITRLLLEKKEPFLNPLLLYGPSKVGKTHLLSSIAKKLEAEGQKVLFVNASTFTSHVVMAIRNNLMSLFRETYRNAHALIVDGVDSFANKAATQEEFFHTFNTLHTQGKLLIISTSSPPSSLNLEPRLVSRLQWGLTLDMHPPSLQELPSILEKKSRSLHFFLQEEVKGFLIKHFSSNFSSMLTALDALILRTPKESTCDLWLAQKLVQDLLEAKKRMISPQNILEKTAEHFGLKKDDLLGKSQKAECSFARQISMHLLRQSLNLPFAKIGELFQRDHSTVMSNIKKIESLIQKNGSKAIETLEQIKGTLTS